MSISMIIAGLFTGLLLGVFGSGGSIITMPTLLYLLDVEPKSAIAMSLGIVAIAATISAIQYWFKGNVNLKVTAIFGIFGIMGTFLGAKLGVITPVVLQLSIFAFVMIVADWKMLKPQAETQPEHKSVGAACVETTDCDYVDIQYGQIAIHGITVGILTGVVGVGGDFLIVPALVLFSGLTIKKAVVTSLSIVALKSFAGFAGHAGSVTIDYQMLIIFTAIAIVGTLIGSQVGHRSPDALLKRGFGSFLIIVAIYILLKEVI